MFAQTHSLKVLVFLHFGSENRKKIGASGGAAQAAEARSCFISVPASWVGPNSEHDPRPKITKVLTVRNSKSLKLLKLGAKPQSSKVFKVIWLPETLRYPTMHPALLDSGAAGCPNAATPVRARVARLRAGSACGVDAAHDGACSRPSRRNALNAWVAGCD